MTLSVDSRSLPNYLQTQMVIIDGEQYVRLRTVAALFAHTAGGAAFRRRWVEWNLPGLWRGEPVWREHYEGAHHFLLRAFEGKE